MKEKIDLFYLHGFNAAPFADSEIVQEMAKLKCINKVHCLGYDSFGTYPSIMETLERDVERHNFSSFAFAGISLGAFYASELARRFDAKSILVNPGRNPYLHLALAIGFPLTNFVTGTPNALSIWSHSSYYNKKIDCAGCKFRPLILLDEDDALISSRTTRRCYEKHAEIHMFSGGNHFFTHVKESIPLIKKYLERPDGDYLQIPNP